MPSLAEIRAKLQASVKKSGNTNSDKLSYRFWDIQAGDTAQVRFLPDGNNNNTFFWVEKQTIKIAFPGVQGDMNNNKEVIVQVPCVEMWGETCPIHQEIRPWFNDPTTEQLARKYWKKRNYIFQGIVRHDPLNESDVENPIRKFVIGSQIYNIIKSAILDPEMEHIPVDYMHGTDFNIVKSSKGNYADYSTSKWARRESPLTEAELESIAKYGLVDLSTYLPERPTAAHMAAIVEMFEASLNGEKYDPERWGQFYKPYGLEIANSSKPASTVQVPVSKPAVTQPAASVIPDDVPFDDPVPAKTTVPAESVIPKQTQASSAQDILAMIRANRNNG